MELDTGRLGSWESEPFSGAITRFGATGSKSYAVIFTNDDGTVGKIAKVWISIHPTVLLLRAPHTELELKQTSLLAQCVLTTHTELGLTLSLYVLRAENSLRQLRVRSPSYNTMQCTLQAKGFQLRTADQNINADTIADLAECGDLDAVLVGDEETTLRRNILEMRLFVKKGTKRMKVTSRLRRFFCDRHTSVPLGTKFIPNDD